MDEERPMFGADMTLTLEATVTHPPGAVVPPPYVPGDGPTDDTADVETSGHGDR